MSESGRLAHRFIRSSTRVLAGLWYVSTLHYRYIPWAWCFPDSLCGRYCSLRLLSQWGAFASKEGWAGLQSGPQSEGASWMKRNGVATLLWTPSMKHVGLYFDQRLILLTEVQLTEANFLAIYHYCHSGVLSYSWITTAKTHLNGNKILHDDLGISILSNYIVDMASSFYHVTHIVGSAPSNAQEWLRIV